MGQFSPSRIRPESSWNPDLPHGFHYVLVPREGGLGYDLNPPALMEAKAWCTDQFGPEGSFFCGDIRWGSVGTEIRIRDEADAIAFKLRWC